MNKKKILIDILVIIVAFSLFVIWYETEINNSAVTASPVKKYTVYLITKDKTIQFYNIVNQGASDMARLLKVNYKWDAPLVRNVDEQISIINNAVSDGAEAIMIAAIDADKVSDAVKNAKAAGVKIIYVDAPANEKGIVTLATDNYNAGSIEGKIMINELEALGIQKGSLGIIGETEETTTTVTRERGIRDAIMADGRFQLLDTKYAGSTIEGAQEAASAYIAESPDLVGLFGTSENTTTGIGNAIKSSNKKPIGVGFDFTETIHKLIDDGYLQAVMVQNPYTMGYLGMAEALAALKDEDTGPSYINTGVSIRTKYIP